MIRQLGKSCSQLHNKWHSIGVQLVGVQDKFFELQQSSSNHVFICDVQKVVDAMCGIHPIG